MSFFVCATQELLHGGISNRWPCFCGFEKIQPAKRSRNARADRAHSAPKMCEIGAIYARDRRSCGAQHVRVRRSCGAQHVCVRRQNPLESRAISARSYRATTAKTISKETCTCDSAQLRQISVRRHIFASFHQHFRGFQKKIAFRICRILRILTRVMFRVFGYQDYQH